MTAPLDFDLHGLCGIRLVDATARDAAAVAGQLGPIQSALDREPDITIRFVDRLELRGRLRLLGLDDAGYTDDAFVVLKGRYKSRARVAIPMRDVGGRCEIVCERGVAQVPLLIPIVNLTVLAGGALPLHAAAFEHRGRGVVATGWSKGGKTETLLAFMSRGAKFVGDEWVYLSRDGQHMYGVPEPIRLWSWHLEHLPEYRPLVSRSDRARLRMVSLMLAGLGRAGANGARHRTAGARTANRLRPLLQKQLGVDVAPQRLFGPERCLLRSRPRTVVFVGSHEDPEVTLRPLDPAEVARRMVFSLQHEQMPFMAYYWKYRFAFPDGANDLVETSAQRQAETLAAALDGKTAYALDHPYPVALDALFEALEPVCVEA